MLAHFKGRASMRAGPERMRNVSWTDDETWRGPHRLALSLSLLCAKLWAKMKVRVFTVWLMHSGVYLAHCTHITISQPTK